MPKNLGEYREGISVALAALGVLLRGQPGDVCCPQKWRGFSCALFVVIEEFLWGSEREFLIIGEKMGLWLVCIIYHEHALSQFIPIQKIASHFHHSLANRLVPSTARNTMDLQRR